MPVNCGSLPPAKNYTLNLIACLSKENVDGDNGGDILTQQKIRQITRWPIGSLSLKKRVKQR